MTDLKDTVWQSKSNKTRYVRVVEAGATHALVAACSAEGKVWATLGHGALNWRRTRVALSADGTRLLRYPLAEYGLRDLTPDEHDRRDAILIRLGRLWRDGIRVVLPPIPAPSRRVR